MKLAVVVALVAAALPARAVADDDFHNATIIFARGASLVRSDPKGKGETELAKLPDKTTVRALRSDAGGKVLLADLGGTWSWMPLDGSASALAPLPCADGPAQLAEDGLCVLCRAGKGGSIIVNLGTGKATPVDVPATGARLAKTGADRELVWADGNGVWTASPRNPRKATKVAPEAPKRGFLPSPDGSRAVGVYADEIFTDAHHKQPADMLMGFQLDGQGARRKAIKQGIAVEWSHDSQWVLVQNAALACLMRAGGGEYKCWRGYTAASIAPDGTFALVLGSKKQPPPAKPTKPAKKGAAKAKPEPAPEPEVDEASSGEDEAAPPDVDVPPPTGPLALYRVRLEGSPYTERPVLVTSNVDGAAVWVPSP